MIGMRGRKIATVVVAAVLPALALAACSSSGSSTGSTASTASGGTYNIGYSDGLTGETAAFAAPAAKQAQAIVDVVNADGGIHGHKIKLTVLDQGNPGSGQAAANVIQLATQDNVSAIIGNSISDDCASVAPLAAKYTVPLLCFRSPTGLLSPVQKYLFLALSTEVAEVAPQIALIKKVVANPHPRVAIIGNDNIGSDQWVTAMKAAVKAMGGTVSTVQDMSETATSASTNTAAIIASHPNVVVGNIFQQFWPPILQGLKTAGLSIPAITIDSDVFYADLLSLKNPNLYEMTLTTPWDPSTTNAQQQKLIAQISKANGSTALDLNQGEGSGPATAVFAVIAGLQACGYPCSGPQLATALEHASTTADGLIPGGYGYSSSMHFGIKEYMFYHWDPSTSSLAIAATEPPGNPVTGAPAS